MPDIEPKLYFSRKAPTLTIRHTNSPLLHPDQDSEDDTSEDRDPADASPAHPAGAVGGLHDYDVIVSVRLILVTLSGRLPHGLNELEGAKGRDAQVMYGNPLFWKYVHAASAASERRPRCPRTKFVRGRELVFLLKSQTSAHEFDTADRHVAG